jgi:hypothetical protein
MLQEKHRASQWSHELQKAAIVQEYQSKINFMEGRLLEAEHRRLDELLELRSKLERQKKMLGNGILRPKRGTWLMRTDNQ